MVIHRLAIHPLAKLVAQRKQNLGEGKRASIDEKVRKPSYSRFTFLANTVLVRKTNNTWRMCIYFTNLNAAYPKDSYPYDNISYARLNNEDPFHPSRKHFLCRIL